MIRKSGHRFSEKIMLNQESQSAIAIHSKAIALSASARRRFADAVEFYRADGAAATGVGANAGCACMPIRNRIGGHGRISH